MIKTKNLFLSLSCLSTFYSMLGFSSSILTHTDTEDLFVNMTPWFTGPIVASSAHTVPPHHGNVEPYFYLTTSSGFYDADRHFISTPKFHSFLQQTPVQVGLTQFMDCQVTPQIFYQFTKKEHSTQFGDLPIGIGFQLLHEEKGSPRPAVKLALKATIPFGKFENLNPGKLGTDGVGGGSWNPTIGLNFSRIYHLAKVHFLAPRFNLSYTIPSPVHINGISTYGGALDTSGTVYPGNIFFCVAAFECTITREFTFAMDITYRHINKTKFSGNPGFLSQIASPSSEQFTLAPALEYNWNANVGIIGGVWFTVAGRNSSQFTSGIIALNIYI